MTQGRNSVYPTLDEWEDLYSRVEETNIIMNNLLEHTQHLSKLDFIAQDISDMKTGLLAAATSKDQISAKLAGQILKILSIVILGLVVCLVFIITGQHFGWIGKVIQ